MRRHTALAPLGNRRVGRTHATRQRQDQRPNISRCVLHFASVGQIVQYVKPTVSKELYVGQGQNGGMANLDELQFNNAYIARVRELREAKDWTAEQMAIALGVPPERYRKYESRSPLPPYLIERFALIVDRDVQYILTGRSFRQAQLPKPGSHQVVRLKG